MGKRIANYTIVIEKDVRTGTGESCYIAFVPVLGLATEADTVEEVQLAAQELIQFHLQSLSEEGEPIPVEDPNSVVAKAEVVLPDNAAVTT